MKFKFLLFILHVKLKQAAKKNAKFMKFIKNKHLNFGIKTADGKSGRFFLFANGQIMSRSGTSGSPDSAMVWADADTGFKVMSSTNDEAALTAMTEKKLAVEGDLKEFLWFSRAVDIMMGKA